MTRVDWAWHTLSMNCLQIKTSQVDPTTTDRFCIMYISNIWNFSRDVLNNCEVCNSEVLLKYLQNFHQSNRSKTFMAPHNSTSGHNVTTMPLDIAVYNAPTSDPFVPNNSYKEYVMRKRGQSARLPVIDYDVSIIIQVENSNDFESPQILCA